VTLRLWTLHPRYLDAQGLVALWREGILARAVLRAETKGYRHHPQLMRFRRHRAPRAAINTYLRAVAAEADARGYSFNRAKLGPGRRRLRLSATQGQLAYEWQHLLRKLRRRSPRLYARWRKLRAPEAHPLFRVVAGKVADWERR
jgi:hypothetical protein